MEIVEYQDEAGGSPFAKWFDSLDLQAAARITRVLTRIALGNSPIASLSAAVCWKIGSSSGPATGSTSVEKVTR